MNYKTKELKRILLAPLDWGLGHATRCIPLIHELCRQGHEVFLAGDGRVQSLLQEEFPELCFLQLTGYNIRYATNRRSLPVVILRQVPRILKAIRYEQEWLAEAMQKYQFDMVISDNRFGLHHPEAHCVFITHQLQIKAPLKLIEWALQKINYHYIEQFDECWVPDFETWFSLAGELSHPEHKPRIPVNYIGPRSRFRFSLPSVVNEHLLILLSGPEPQRTLLEQKIFSQLKHVEEKVLVVRGLPGQVEAPVAGPNVVIRNHLGAKELQDAFSEASLVIGRSGYSTVMDIMAMRKRSILIPTQGQTEQEYLARHLMEHRLAFSVDQDRFNLRAALSLAESFPYEIDEK